MHMVTEGNWNVFQQDEKCYLFIPCHVQDCKKMQLLCPATTLPFAAGPEGMPTRPGH